MNSEFQDALSQWTRMIEARDAELKKQMDKSKSLKSWNCKNCGGPNLNEPKCRYCGAVEE